MQALDAGCSHEAGLGTVPNVAATADVKHPIARPGSESERLIDTIVLCRALH